MIVSTKRSSFTIEEVTDPQEIADFQRRHALFMQNSDWLQQNIHQVYGPPENRGKHVCVSGQEAFIAGTVEEAIGQARARHPGDDGRFTRFIPKEKGPRIYAH